jgi:hypothetical protein
MAVILNSPGSHLTVLIKLGADSVLEVPEQAKPRQDHAQGMPPPALGERRSRLTSKQPNDLLRITHSQGLSRYFRQLSTPSGDLCIPYLGLAHVGLDPSPLACLTSCVHHLDICGHLASQRPYCLCSAWSLGSRTAFAAHVSPAMTSRRNVLTLRARESWRACANSNTAGMLFAIPRHRTCGSICHHSQRSWLDVYIFN